MIKDLLAQQRRSILDRWTEELLDAYPAESSPFLKGERDRFRNPVGYTIADGLERIFDGLLSREADEKAERAVEDVIRMRAVQQFSPSEAVAFMMPLKGLIREVVESIAADSPTRIGKELCGEFVSLEAVLDRLTLVAVDCYAGCREAIYRASLREARAGGMVGPSVMRGKTR